MNIREFDAVMRDFYAEFRWGGEDAVERAEVYERHWRALADLPAPAVEAAVRSVVAEWTDEKRKPPIGLVRAKAQDWLAAKLRGSNLPQLAQSEHCRWCAAIAGVQRGSLSPRLVIQHAPGCRFHDPAVEVAVEEGDTEEGLLSVIALLKKHGVGP